MAFALCIFLPGLFSQTVAPVAIPVVSLPAKSDAITEAITLLRSTYYNPGALKFFSGEKLEDLVAELHGGAYIGSRKNGEMLAKTGSSPVSSTLLAYHFLYSHMASFHPPSEGWENLEKQLQDASINEVRGAILDLRENQTQDDLERVAQIAGYFIPPAQKLFSLRGEHLSSARSYYQRCPRRLFAGPVVVLTNGHTSGSAEVLAACLQNAGALVVGHNTAGHSGIFAERRLSDGQMLGYAIGEVRLADGTRLIGRPVKADITLDWDEATEQKALNLLAEQGPEAVIKEIPSRHKLNEAALVRNENPELEDSFNASQKGNGGTIQDLALMQALDSLRAIRVTLHSGNSSELEKLRTP